MPRPRIGVDFNRSDTNGYVRLSTVGTMEDLERQKVVLCEELLLTLYDQTLYDEEGEVFEVDATVTLSTCPVYSGSWVAIVERDDFRPVSGSE